MTTPSFKDYDAIVAARRAEIGEPLRFRFNGRIYTTLPEIQVTALSALSDDGLDSTVEFIASALVPEDREEFRALANGKQPVKGSKKQNDFYIFSPKSLEELTSDLTGYFSGKAIEQSSH